MATELQNRANRANSLKSTGPQSDAGKAVVRLNAVRHGLLSSAPIMAGEDESEFNELGAQLQSELKPVGLLETQTVNRMAGFLWRLRRAQHIEAGLLTSSAAEVFAEAAEQRAKSHTRTEGGLDALLESLGDGGGETTIVDEAGHADAMEAAQNARDVSFSAPVLLGAAFGRDAGGADALGKLTRYETGIERALYRATEELEKLQSARRERDKASGVVGKMMRRALERSAARDDDE
jgi:hypothetical protein